MSGAAHAAWVSSATVIALAMSVPVLVVLAYGFSDGGAAWAHLRATTLWTYAGNTIALMLLTGALAAVIGTTVAWLIAATAFPGRRHFKWLLVLPLAAPPYVVAYMYTDLLGFSGPVQTLLRDVFGWVAGEYWFPTIRSLPGAALILSLVLYPYVYLLAQAAFSGQVATQFDAARTLGATPRRDLRDDAPHCSGDRACCQLASDQKAK